MRVGFCCMWESEAGQSTLLNQRTTTVRHLSTLTKLQQIAKLQTLIDANVQGLSAMVDRLISFPLGRRMFRIGSSLFPLYSHRQVEELYLSGDVNLHSDTLAAIGARARENDVRLSFHPGQFTLLQSKTPGVVEQGVQEFEYHATVAKMMGYTDWHQDGFAINIHMGGNATDCSGFRSVFLSLSETARNLITVENDEFTWGTRRLVDEVGDLCPIVIDLHHHHLYEQTAVGATEELVKDVSATWRGIRPKLHVAMSREELVRDWVSGDGTADYAHMMREGLRKSDLRQHSDTAWHEPTIDYWLSFASTFDLMFEGKLKNVGQLAIFRRSIM